MTDTSFYEDESTKLLTCGAFEHVLDGELKRAVRSQNYLTLVRVEASREWEGMTLAADTGIVHEVAEILGHEIRDTDLMGRADDGVLALVLIDANLEQSELVVNRLVSRMDDHEFSSALRIAVGAACYPTDAVDAPALMRQAMSHPIASWRGGPSDDKSSLSSN